MRFAGGIAIFAATVAGCGPTTASSSAEDLVPSEPTMINYGDPSQVNGLDVHTVTGDGPGDQRVHAVYPSLEGAPRLTGKLHRTVAEWLDRFNHGTLGNAPGEKAWETASPAHPEFNVDWQLAAVSSQVIGVRLRIGRSAGADWVEARTTVWYDRVDTRALDSDALLRGRPELAELAVLVKGRLAGSRPEVNPGVIRPEAELFDSLAFNPRGDLVVEFDDHQVASASHGRVAVAVPASEVGPLLSATGVRAQRAAVKAVAGMGAVSPQRTIRETSIPRPRAESSQAGSVDCAKAKCVALTYDDGPGPGTGRLLDVLGGHRARATFFSTGTNASAYPELLRRMMREGHLVGNHTWSHRDLTSLTDSKATDQIDRAQCAITRAIGQVPGLLRPPYGVTDGRTASVAGRLGLTLVGWSVDTGDERGADAKTVADRAVAGAGRGSVILLHDVRGSAVEATPDILRRLGRKGYTFVTVPELYGSQGMRAGGIYGSEGGPAAPGRPAMP